jgi:glycosyltransferase 2 family protein
METLNQPSSVPRRRGPQLIKQGFGLLVTVGCIYFIFRNVDRHALWLALSEFHWPLLVFGLCSLVVGYTARIIRWTMMLNGAGAKVTFRQCVAPFLGSIALNNVLPLRIGDVLRALVFPGALGLDRSTATASVILERLVDLLSLLICFAIAMATTNLQHAPSWLQETAETLAVLGSVGLFCVVFGSPLLARLLTYMLGRLENAGKSPKLLNALGFARDLFASMAQMSRFRLMLALFGLSVVVWVGELGLYVSLLRGTGIGANIAAGLLFMSMATLATLVPSSPGYIGPFHLAAFAAISMLGGTTAQATSLALLAHLSVWLSTTIVGGIAIATHPQLFRGGWKAAPELL